MIGILDGTPEGHGMPCPYTLERGNEYASGLRGYVLFTPHLNPLPLGERRLWWEQSCHGRPPTAADKGVTLEIDLNYYPGDEGQILPQVIPASGGSHKGVAWTSGLVCSLREDSPNIAAGHTCWANCSISGLYFAGVLILLINIIYSTQLF